MSQKINVTRSSMPPYEEYINEIKDLWDTRWLTNMGEKHNKLEQMLSSYLTAEKVSLFCNGHMALELLLSAYQLKGEVITTPFTFVSTTHAIVRAGLTPVFCDIRSDDCTIDSKKIEPLITEKTCAILPVHVYGNLCDVESLNNISKKYNLKLIYDAAHAFGVKKNNIGVGAWGDASMLSFHATKVFHTIEGGCVCSSDINLHNRLNQYRDFGITDAEHVEFCAPNAKMTEFNAAMGICNLRHINEAIAKRKEAVERYLYRLSEIKGIKVLLSNSSNVMSNYAYMPIQIDPKQFACDRNEVQERLSRHGIGARKYFFPLTSESACYKNFYCANDTPIAKHISEQVLTLPLFEDISLADVDQICDIIMDY